MASVQKYLQDKLDEHCQDYVQTNMQLDPDDEEYDEEVQDHKQLMEMGIWRNEEIISTAYYMEIPKKALYRFGYTKAEINRIFSDEFAEDEYPY